MRKRVVCALGTRPEAIKMAPVFQALMQQPQLEPLLVLTGQHREQLEQGLAIFDLPVAVNLDLMTERQSLPELAAKIIPKASSTLRDLRADYVLVHGDTLSTFAVAWAAFLERISVAHVEAGLRSHSLSEPFPEEANRKLTDAIADLCLAPTELGRDNLIAEGVARERIVVTGQTGVDAILYAASAGSLPIEVPPHDILVTITLHRRENWPILVELAAILSRVAQRYPHVQFVYPVHMNPIVREAIWPSLEHEPNVKLLDPLEYGQMARLVANSGLLITDSGGLQEEGMALGVPVLVVRNVTERPEGLATGGLLLAGTEPLQVYERICGLLSDPIALRRMRAAPNPYGDGNAGARVAQAVAWRLGVDTRPNDWAFQSR